MLELLPDSIHYSNVLHYQPQSVAHSRPFSLPVDCSYPRVGTVSPRATQPRWISSSSTAAQHRGLRFALHVYDGSWSSQLPQPPRYRPGELINLEASVGTNHQLPLRVFIDECEASPGVAEWLSYEVIAEDGCLLHGQLGRSRFLPQRGNSSLRFQLDTLLFPSASGSQIYLRCHLKAVARGAGGTLGKACSYDPVRGAWHSLDGANCSCCASPAGCRGQGLGTPRGVLGEATVLLGPLELLSALPGSSPGIPTAPEPGTMPSPHPSVPLARGEKRHSRPAAPGTTLAMVAMCSVLLAAAAAGCCCSVRRRRAALTEAALTEAAPGQPRALPMAPTLPRPCPAPLDPSVA